MSDRVERALSALLTLAALVIAVAVVYRTFLVTPPARANAPEGQPEFLAFWQEALPAGIRSGASNAPITVVAVTDLECPACKAFEGTLRAVAQEHPSDVAIVYVSYPLPQHRFALGAARAAECANEEGRFDAWVEAVFAKQDSLGLRSWGSYAADAGIADTAKVARCAVNSALVSRIEAGKRFGDKIQMTGTPTVIVNGWRLPFTPSGTELRRIISTLKRGEQPFPTSVQAGDA